MADLPDYAPDAAEQYFLLMVGFRDSFQESMRHIAQLEQRVEVLETALSNEGLHQRCSDWCPMNDGKGSSRPRICNCGAVETNALIHKALYPS